MGQRDANPTLIGKEKSERGLVATSHAYSSILTSFLLISAGITGLPLLTDYGIQSVESAGCHTMAASSVSSGSVNITVNCGQTQGVIPALFVGHYDVDPTRTEIGLDDTVGTRLMKDIDLGFWRVSIGRWEMMDFPSSEDIEKREYFKGSTFQDAGNASMYCWEHMDEVFNSVSQFNCTPLICIDYMPRTLANNTSELPPERGYTFPNHIRNSPPKNATVFAEVIKHVVTHYTQGWPNGTGQYYDFEFWEVWNEPELGIFWNGTMQVLYQVYAGISKAVKTIDTTANPLSYKIGGLSFALPGSTGMSGEITPFLSYCETNSLSLDFLSWHGYPDNFSNLINATQIAHSELQEFGFGNAMNILAEWGLPLGIGVKLWDSNYYAAFTSLILSDLAESELVDYQTHSCMKDRDIVNSSGGYWGILHKDPTTPKPVYYVFKAFDMLNETNHSLKHSLISFSKASGQAAIVGRSSDNKTITLIYSNFNGTTKSVSINFMNLPWEAGSTFGYTRYLIDNETSLKEIDSWSSIVNASAEDLSGQVTEVQTAFTAEPYTVHVIRIALTEPTADGFTAILVLSVAAVTAAASAIGIIIRRRGTRSRT